MTSALLLALYALAASVAGPLLLRDARWVLRAPRLGIAAWLALSLTVLSAVGLGALALIVALPHVSRDLASLIDLCASGLRHNYGAPGGALGPVVGVATLGSLAARLMWSLVATLVGQRSERRRAVVRLELVARRRLPGGALVVEHAAPYAFCVPGRRPRVVLTTALVDALSGRQLAAVMAHERAHLRQRHHLVLLCPRVLARAFAWVIPLYRVAEEQTACLVEMCADDAARHEVGCEPLREALGRLAWRLSGSTVLAATSHAVEQRLSRLTEPHRPRSWVRGVVAGAAILLGALAPLALVVAPALAAAWDGLCIIA